MPEDKLEAMRQAAIDAARAVDYVGAVAPKGYICNANGQFTPPLDGCGHCLLYVQNGYQLTAPTVIDDIPFAYVHNQPVPKAKYSCAPRYAVDGGGIRDSSHSVRG